MIDSYISTFIFIVIFIIVICGCNVFTITSNNTSKVCGFRIIENDMIAKEEVKFGIEKFDGTDFEY